MHTITSEIIIQAPAEKVWITLLDFEQYPNWNPFIKYIKGKPGLGEKLEAKMQPVNSSGMVYKPKILKFVENHELRWLGHTYIPGLFDGEHVFKLEMIDLNNTKFIQTEYFTGILTPIFKSFLDNNTLTSFKEMNIAFKNLVELKVRS